MTENDKIKAIVHDIEKLKIAHENLYNFKKAQNQNATQEFHVIEGLSLSLDFCKKYLEE